MFYIPIFTSYIYIYNHDKSLYEIWQVGEQMTINNINEPNIARFQVGKNKLNSCLS
jgi:hypothetical protein